MKGIFIVFEGIDGSGKSTQINNLEKWLPHSGLMPKDASLKITREPGGTLLGNRLRNLILNPEKNQIPQVTTELLLYAADRAQHVNEIIIPALDNGDWVISDRFSGSTLAYQGYGRDININLIKELELIATGGLQPDLTILLEISTNESVTRRRNKLEDRIEAEGESFLEKVSFGFQKIAQDRNWKIIPASQEEKIVNIGVKNAIKTYLENTHKYND